MPAGQFMPSNSRTALMRPVRSLDWMKQQEYSPLGYDWVKNILSRNPAKTTHALIPLLTERNQAHSAITELGRIGTKPAVAALIDHFNGERFAEACQPDSEVHKQAIQAAYARHCAAALWRLTGETLDMENWSDERLLEAGKPRWEKWWNDRPEDFAVKTEAWWKSPAAAPKVIEAVEAPCRYCSAWAFQDLLDMEHPVLRKYLVSNSRHSNLSVAKIWLNYEPRVAIPAFFPFADSRGYDLPRMLQPALSPNDDRDRNHQAWQACWKCKSSQDWRSWWETYSDTLKFQPRDRWW